MFGLENMITLILGYLSQRDIGSAKAEFRKRTVLRKRSKGLVRERPGNQREEEFRKQLGDCYHEAISGSQRC